MAILGDCVQPAADEMGARGTVQGLLGKLFGDVLGVPLILHIWLPRWGDL